MSTAAKGWYSYRLGRDLVPEEVAGLKALAGPIYLQWKQEVVAHINCAWLLERWLASSSIPVIGFTLGALPARLAEPVVLPELREWVWDFMTPYQRELVLWGGERDGILAIMPTGAGKSLAGIVWGLLAPGLIVFVTRAGARRTVCGEIRRFTTCEPVLIEGLTATAIPPATRFVVVGWEHLITHVSALLRAGPVTLIADESHLAANHKRREAIVPRDEELLEAQRNGKGEVKLSFRKLHNRFAAAEDLSRRCQRRLGLTATPIRDRLRNLWGQLDLVCPRGFGGFYRWAARYANAHANPWGGIDTTGRGTDEQLAELVSRLSFNTFYVSHATTHRDLPPVRRQVTYIPPHELSTGRDVLKELREHPFGKGGGVWAQLALAAAMKRSRVVEEALAGAFRAADGQSGGKVTIFTGLRHDAERIAADIQRADGSRGKNATPLKVWCAHGGMAPKVRDVIREEYMAHAGPCVLVATGDSMGESVNLHDTDLAIMAMLPWEPGKVRQREGRFQRLGMLRPVLILYLIAEGTYDEHVAQTVLEKLPAVEQVAKDAILTGFSDAIRGDEETIMQGLLGKLTSEDVNEGA